MQPPATERVKVVVRLWHGWNLKDFESGMHYLADDVEVASATTDQLSFTGHDGIRRWRDELAENGIETVSTPYQWEQRGRHVLVRGLLTRSIKGVPEEEEDLCWAFRFDPEGKVSGIGTFLDYDQALGWLAEGRYTR